MGVRVIICGGRDLHGTRITAWAFDRLDVVHRALRITEVIEGGALGGDRIGRLWADSMRLPVTTVPADWEAHGRKAGYLRNVAMADMAPDYVIALPGGVGTKMMTDIARERGIPRVYLEKVNPA